MNDIALVIGCVRWLSHYISENESELEKGLFRVSPGETSSNAFKSKLEFTQDQVITVADVLSKIESFVAAEKESRGISECANTVAAFLKKVLRDMKNPVLAFPFCCEFVPVATNRDAIAIELGQDLLTSIAEIHDDFSAEQLCALADMLGKLFSLLNTVAETPAFSMGPYELFVPFLPSLAGARDSMLIMNEQQQLATLVQTRQKAVTEKQPVPVSRLEVIIQHGHKILGYFNEIKPLLPNLFRQLKEQIKQAEALEKSASRKRAFFVKALKPHTWFNAKSEGKSHEGSASARDLLDQSGAAGAITRVESITDVDV